MRVVQVLPHLPDVSISIVVLDDDVDPAIGRLPTLNDLVIESIGLFPSSRLLMSRPMLTRHATLSTPAITHCRVGTADSITINQNAARDNGKRSPESPASAAA